MLHTFFSSLTQILHKTFSYTSLYNFLSALLHSTILCYHVKLYTYEQLVKMNFRTNALELV